MNNKQRLFEKYMVKKNDLLDDTEDEEYNDLMDIVLDLDPDTLDDDALEKVNNILGDIDNTSEIRMAKKTSIAKRRRQRKYYQKYKEKIKKKKKQFAKSMEGRKRERMKKRMEKTGRTPTGRRKTRYH